MVDEKSKFDDDDEIIEIPDLDEETEVNKRRYETNLSMLDNLAYFRSGSLSP